MKLIQQAKGKLSTKSTIDVDRIINQIKDYDIVSFDIFDTLLKRNVEKPTDVFKYIEKNTIKLDSVKRELLLRKRQE